MIFFFIICLHLILLPQLFSPLYCAPCPFPFFTEQQTDSSSWVATRGPIRVFGRERDRGNSEGEWNRWMSEKKEEISDNSNFQCRNSFGIGHSLFLFPPSFLRLEKKHVGICVWVWLKQTNILTTNICGHVECFHMRELCIGETEPFSDLRPSLLNRSVE